MVKRLIFDLDNTLIIWKDEYLNAIKKTIADNNLDLDYLYVNELIESYELHYNHFDRELLLNYINSKLADVKFTKKALDDFLINIGYMSEPNEDVIKTLEYLKDKYELVVLTMWFKEPQSMRLKNANILKYFKDVVGGEEVMKPHPDAFKKAMGDCKPDECIMIGDTYDIDIMGAYKMGIKPIFVNPHGKPNRLHVTEIKEVKDLMEIL